MTYALLALLAGMQVRPAGSSTSVPDLNVGDAVRLETRTIAGKYVTGELRAANQGFVAMSIANTDANVWVAWTHIASLSRATHRDRTSTLATGLVLGAAAATVVGPSLITYGTLPTGGAALGWMIGVPRWSPVTWRPTMDTVMLDGEATRLSLPEGMPVMLRAGGRLVRARVAGVSDDSIFVLRDDARSAFAWRQTTELRIRSGRNRIKGAAIGMVLGGVTGAAVYLLTHDEQPQPGAQPNGLPLMRRIGLGVLAGTGLGFAVGVPGWTRMPFPVR